MNCKKKCQLKEKYTSNYNSQALGHPPPRQQLLQLRAVRAGIRLRLARGARRLPPLLLRRKVLHRLLQHQAPTVRGPIGCYWRSLAAVGGGLLHKTHGRFGAVMTPKVYGHGKKKIHRRNSNYGQKSSTGGHWCLFSTSICRSAASFA